MQGDVKNYESEMKIENSQEKNIGQLWYGEIEDGMGSNKEQNLHSVVDYKLTAVVWMFVCHHKVDTLKSHLPRWQ